MGLSAYNARTFFFHQKNFLFPAVLSYWERYQAALVEKIKNIKDAVWSADGRFHSMGHSAKFGVYVLFCNTILKVVHFELLQVSGVLRNAQLCFWKRWRLDNFSEPEFCSTSNCTGTFFFTTNFVSCFVCVCACVCLLISKPVGGGQLAVPNLVTTHIKIALGLFLFCSIN